MQRPVPKVRRYGVGIRAASPLLAIVLVGVAGWTVPASGASSGSMATPRAVEVGSASRTAERADRVPSPTDTLRGRVTDADGRPLPGVEVAISEIGRIVLTDATGRFMAPEIPAGRYTLTFRHPGFAPAVRRVDVTRSARVDVVLQIRPFAVEGVTVTATGMPIQGRESPLPSVVLSSSDLRREHSVSLAHTLENVAGVRSLSTGQQVGNPVIRGLSGARVKVLEDGLPLEYYSWSGEDGPSVDPRLAERVEVIRGPASVLYGSEALGGVVNVIPAPVPEAPEGAGFVRGEGEAYGATNNAELGGVLRLEGARGVFGWRAVGIGRHAADLHTPGGELDNTGFGALNGELAAGLRGGWGNVTVRYERYGGEFKLLEASGNPRGPLGEPDTAAAPAAEEGGPERKLSDDRVRIVSHVPVGGLALETQAGWQRHLTSEFAEEGEAEAGGGGEAEFELLLNTLTFRTLARHALGERVHGSVGLSGVYSRSESEGQLPIVPDAHTLSGGVFAFEEANLSRLRLFAGARFDARRLHAEPSASLDVSEQDRDYTALSASLGASVPVAYGLSLSGNVGRAWRAPTLFELFANGPLIGEARFEVGRPNLKTETSLNLDLGLRFQRGIASAEVHTYRNAIQDYIFLAPTNEMRDGLRVYRHAQADARLWGGEASAQVEPTPTLALRGRFDMVRGTNTQTDEPLPLIPPRRGDVEAEIHGTGVGPADRAYLRLGLEMVAEQTRLGQFDVPTDGYHLLEAAAGAETLVGGRPIRLDIAVHNAADESYRDFLSRYKEFALDPGRNLVVRVGTTF